MHANVRDSSHMTRPAFIPWLVLLTFVWLTPPVGAQSLRCDQASTAFEIAFDSGAGWQGCWRVDPIGGLTLSSVHYQTPDGNSRHALAELGLGGVLLHYDKNDSSQELLTQRGAMITGQPVCAGTTVASSDSLTTLCRTPFDAGHLLRYQNRQVKRQAGVRLSHAAKLGSFDWSVSYELLEDGTVRPGSTLSGRLGQFTDNPQHGNDILGADAADAIKPFAATATVVTNWRVDVSIGETFDNDIVEQFDFTSDNTSFDRRLMSQQTLNVETLRRTDPERFRKWRVYDAELSASTDGVNETRVGYLLDPQPQSYRYRSNTINFAQFDLMVTVNNACERFILNNRSVYPDCADALDRFINGQLLADEDPVLWFSITRRIDPTLNDWPTLQPRKSQFSLIPFDWSQNSPFEQAVLP